MREMVIFGLIALVLVGCAIPQPVSMQTSFDRKEHMPFIQAGTNTVRGQAFLRQQGGGVVTCAGIEVHLLPSTSYFREFMRHVRAGKKPQASGKVGAEFASIWKKAQCDAQGNFVFHDLANGTWFVATDVQWTVGYSLQGGKLLKEVTVADGETVQVLLSDQDRI
jgi:hypothetical protein